MFGDPKCPEPAFHIYIDEAGDPGTKKVRPVDVNGSSEWFVVSAVVIQAAREAEAVDWVREIKHSVYQNQRPDLHYRNLAPSRRLRACELLATKEVRCFAVVSHKVNMRGFRNPRAEMKGSQEHFYNWCVRILLERVTRWCRERAIRHFGEPRAAKLIFSERGGLRYTQLVAYHEYLRRQSASNALYLSRGDIAWDVLHPDLYASIPHHKSAGAQLADVVASAFYQAADARAPGWILDPALALRPRMATRGRSIVDAGLTLMPLPPKKAELTEDQKRIFNAYGYGL